MLGRLQERFEQTYIYIEIEIERERERERGVRALGKRDLALARLSASDSSYYNLLQAEYTRNTFNSDTQTVVVVINALNVHLVYANVLGAQGNDLPLPNV